LANMPSCSRGRQGSFHNSLIKIHFSPTPRGAPPNAVCGFGQPANPLGPLAPLRSRGIPLLTLETCRHVHPPHRLLRQERTCLGARRSDYRSNRSDRHRADLPGPALELARRRQRCRVCLVRHLRLLSCLCIGRTSVG